MIEKTIAAPTNIEGFIKNLRSIFVNLSFEIQSSDTTSFTMLNRQRMQSNRQNPLMGVSEISVSLNGNNINILADITNVQRLKKFLMIFPPALAIGMGILFAISTFVGAMPKSPATWATPLGLAVFFPLIFFPMGIMIERSTITALDTAIKNAIAMANEE